MRLSLLALLVSLSACSGAPDRGVAARGSGIGFAERGALTSGDARYGASYVDGYSVNVSTDRPLALSVSSGAFDPVMVVVGPSGEAEVVTSCSGTDNACVLISEPARGMWNVRITSRTEGASGGYTFAVGAPLTGVVAAESLASRDAPLLPLRSATATGPAPEAAPQVPTPEAPTRPEATAPEATLPIPDEVAEPSVGQSLSGTFTGVDQRYRLDGRERPAVTSPARLLAGDVINVQFASSAFTPLLVLAFNGEPVATARADAASGGRQSALLRYEVPSTGTYALYLATTDAELAGAFEASVSFVRDRERIRQAPEVEPVLRRSGLPHSQISALRATFDVAPRFGDLRGALLARDPSAGDVYLSEMPIPGSSQTNVICEGERCSVFAVFPTLDPNSAVNTAANLVTAINTVTEYALDEPAAPSDPNAFMELVSDDVSVRVSYDVNRYDETLGVPVVLRIDSR